jgi:hypothetical protein
LIERHPEGGAMATTEAGLRAGSRGDFSIAGENLGEHALASPMAPALADSSDFLEK